MPTDHTVHACVAWIVSVVAACGPTSAPARPGNQPEAVGAPRAPNPGGYSAGSQVVVGQMCPQGAGGRPAVSPLAMRTVGWSDVAVDLANTIERGSVQRFAVFDDAGKQAGVFDTIGLADISPHVSVATGAYTGALPCTTDGGSGLRLEAPACGPTATGCGIAVGVLGRPDDPPELPVVTTGGACLQGDGLAVDIDGDDVMELFPLASLLDGARGPAEEWTAAPEVGVACKTTFAIHDAKVEHLQRLDVVGVLDVDGDGRVELVLALTFPTAKTIAIYTAASSPQRLVLAGEGRAF